MAEDRVMETYLQEIARIPLLTPEEEKKLARKAARGYRKAKNKLAADNTQDENNHLKRIIGLAQTDTWDTIDAEFNKDMDTYASAINVGDANRNYRKVLEAFFNVVRQKNVSFSSSRAAGAAIIVSETWFCSSTRSC